MRKLIDEPWDRLIANRWISLDPQLRSAFFIVVTLNVLAFGYEMTNLTLHHDDVSQIFIEDTILGHYLGRFGVGALHYYTQNAYFMPFLQMAEGILIMSVYGLLISHFWGMRKAADIAIPAAIICVFPFMAQIHQYNTAMATYPVAHLLAAIAVVLSVKATPVPVAVSALLYAAAFSIYQSVAAVAAVIFLVWVLRILLWPTAPQSVFFSVAMAKSTAGALVSAVAGGLLYLLTVWAMDIQFDSYQGAEKAFTLTDRVDLASAMSQIVAGTRSSFLWPENYFPNYLKKLQLIFIACAAFCCLWLPRKPVYKITALAVLIAALVSPRILQLLHPEGRYHNLTLTGYAVSIAACVAVALRAGWNSLRNVALLLALGLVAGYIMQCNWISTVNQLNTYAHYSALSQILTRVRALPPDRWDGRTVVVVGRYDMPSRYPFKSATGVATEFMDASHMDMLARLMREEIKFVPPSESTRTALAFANTHPVWPSSDSVGITDGVAIVVLSKNQLQPASGEPTGDSQSHE